MTAPSRCLLKTNKANHRNKTKGREIIKRKNYGRIYRAKSLAHFVNNRLDASLEGSGFVEISQKNPEVVVCSFTCTQYPGCFANSLHFHFQQKESNKLKFLLDEKQENDKGFLC